MRHGLSIAAAAICGAGAQTIAARGATWEAIAGAVALFAAGGWLLARTDRQRPPRLRLWDEPPSLARLSRLRWSWLLLAAALGLSALAASRLEITLSRPHVACWAASMAALLTFAWAADRGAPALSAGGEGGPRARLALELAAVTALGFAFRLWRLGENPPLIWDDEIVYLLDALDLAGFGPFSPFANGGWGAPHLHAYTIAAGTWLTPDHAAALRLASAIPGALSVPLLWLALRELFDRRFAFFGALLLAVAAWPTLLSRQGYIWAINPFAELIAIYWLARALGRGRYLDFTLAGFGLGLCVFYGYAGMMMPLVIIAFAAYLAVAGRRWLRAQLAGLGLMILASLVLTAPRLTTVASDPEASAYFARASLFSTEAEGAWRGIGRQLGQIALSFNQRADNNELFVPVANKPLLDPVTAASFGLGFFWALFSLGQMGAFLLLATFGVFLLPPALGLSSTEWATAWRACGVVPAVFGLAAAPFAIAARAAERRRGVAFAVLGGLVAFAAIINWHWYFVRHPNKARWHYGSNAMRTRAARLVLEAPKSTRVVVNHDLEAFQTIGLLGGRRDYERLTWPDDLILPALLTPEARDTLVVAGAQLYWEDDVSAGAVLIDLLEHYYPGGRRIEENGVDGRPLFAAYELSAAQIVEAHGLARTEQGWAGTLLVDRPGWYRLEVRDFAQGQAAVSAGTARPTQDARTARPTTTAASARIRLNGREFGEGPLPQGLYALEVLKPEDQEPSILWGRDGGDLEPVPAADLLRRGLPAWGFTERALDIEGREAWRRWTPILWFSAAGRAFDIAPEHAVEWTADIEVPQPGAYTLLFMASAPSSLWIDGEEKLSRAVAWPSWERFPVDFSAGRHRVRVLSEPLVENRDVHLYWVAGGKPGHFRGTGSLGSALTPVASP